MTASHSRRSFLTTSSVAIAGSVATGTPAADTIRVGVIGSGGRARHLMNSLAKVPDVRITAVCDVWDVALNEGKKLAEPNAFTTKEARRLLDMKEIDAVLVGTPDHWHVPMTIAACHAGKDVYVEKPLTHSASEGEAVIAAARDGKRIVQVGTQQRSMPHIAEARELVAAGRIGSVVKVKMSWNRNSDRVKRFPLGVKPAEVDWKSFLGSAKDQPFDEYRFRNWRWFWDFGGGIFTDLMVHWIDVAHWVLGVETPTKAVSLGEFIAAKDVWETPDTVQTILSYPGGIQMHFEGTFSNARPGARIEFLGTDATMYVDRGRYELIPEPRRNQIVAQQRIDGTGPPGADFYEKPDGELLHLTNWIDCIRTRKTPNSPVESGVASAAAAHLSNESLRTGRLAGGR